MIISSIVAVAENGVIGLDGDIPWYLSSDFKYFKKTTMNAPIIMGRNCFESIGRPLPKRLNIIISRDPFYVVSGAFVVHSINEALELASENSPEECFIIGGGEIYKQTIHLWDKLYYTEVHMTPEGDTFFPEVNWEEWSLISRTYHEKEEKDYCDCTFKVFIKRELQDSNIPSGH
ncbi:MAG: dihydrofolate reductase [Saprospiraceae bacterium]|nr:dihydrofolate reductase [Candidatus Brachybacter algidus]